MMNETSSAHPSCHGGIVLPEEPKIVVSGSHIFVSVAINGYIITIAKRNLENFDAQDPYFFDSDYTIAGSTGFLLWEANWLILRLLRSTPLNPFPSILPQPPPPPPPSSPTKPPHLSATTHPSQPPSSPTNLRLAQLLSGRRVLDLGSGTGLTGLCAAACGAHVLLTDLSSVCTGMLQPNLQRNALTPTSPSRAGQERTVSKEDAAATKVKAFHLPSLASLSPAPAPLPLFPTERNDPGPNLDPVGSSTAATVPVVEAAEAPTAAAAIAHDRNGPHSSDLTVPAPGVPWVGAVRVGRGTAAVMPLDWSEPLEPQVATGGNDPRDADFILAVDTIWLLDIFHCFINVVLAVLNRGALAPDPTPPISTTSTTVIATTATLHSTTDGTMSASSAPTRACFLAFVERASADSKLFVRKETVIEVLQSRGCQVEVVLAEDVDVDGVGRPGRVLRVTLGKGGVGAGQS